jgi:hypothetical protein
MKASGSPDTRSSRFGGGPGNLTGAPRRQAHPTEVHRTLSHPAVGDERVVDPQNLVDDRVQLGIRDARAQAGLQPGTAGQVVHQHSDAQRDGAEVAAGSVAQHRHDLGVGELAHNGAGLRDRLHRGSPRQGPHHYGHQMPAASGRWSRSQSRIGFRRRHYWRQRSVRQRPPQAVHARRHSRLSSGQLGIAVAEHRPGAATRSSRPPVPDSAATTAVHGEGRWWANREDGPQRRPCAGPAVGMGRRGRAR